MPFNADVLYEKMYFEFQFYVRIYPKTVPDPDYRFPYLVIALAKIGEKSHGGNKPYLRVTLNVPPS